MESTKREVTVVAGLSGTGKSTFTLRLLLNGLYDERFIFDPNGEYAERLGIEPARDAYELGLALCQGWVLFQPHVLFHGRFDEGFAFFCDWSYQMSGQLPGRKVLVVDEAWKYVTTRRHPAELESCVREGRHVGLDSIFNSQTPGQLHETIRNECTELVCFSLQDDKSLAWPKERGLDPDELKSLPDLHFVSRTLRGAELRGVIKL